MASNKDKSLSSRKEAIGKRAWPNLPQQLLNLLATKRDMLRQLSYPGTTKSWTNTTKRCNGNKHPKLPQLHDLEGSSKRRCSAKTDLQHFINISFRIQVYAEWQYFFYQRSISPFQFWDFEIGHFAGVTNGSLIMCGPHWSSDLGLVSYDISSRTSWYIGPWDAHIPFKYVVLSSSSERNLIDRTVVVLTGISSPSLVVHTYIQGEYKCVKQDVDTIDPYDAKKKPMLFTNIIAFEGKFYALSLQGTLAVMEVIDSRLVIVSVGKNRAVPCAETRYFKENLLESNGEILLVFLMYRKTLSVVDKVEVFRLHLGKLEWVKVEKLEERALFLECECCIWVNSSRVGCRGNSVYFTQTAEDGKWFVYDMGSGCISSDLTWSEPILEE